MENTKIEAAAIEEALRQAEQQFRELNDLQLVLVGGGIGNTII